MLSHRQNPKHCARPASNRRVGAARRSAGICKTPSRRWISSDASRPSGRSSSMRLDRIRRGGLASNYLGGGGGPTGSHQQWPAKIPGAWASFAQGDAGKPTVPDGNCCSPGATIHAPPLLSSRSGNPIRTAFGGAPSVVMWLASGKGRWGPRSWLGSRVTPAVRRRRTRRRMGGGSTTGAVSSSSGGPSLQVPRRGSAREREWKRGVYAGFWGRMCSSSRPRRSQNTAL